MITGAALAPFRDRLSALIAAARDPLPPTGLVPQWMIDEGCSALAFFDGFDDPTMIDPIRYSWDGVGPAPTDSNWYMPVYPTQPTDYVVAHHSVADSVLKITHPGELTISNDSSGGAGSTLVSCPHGYPSKGHTFRGSHCYETRARWDAGAAPDHFPNVGGVFWSNSVNLMLWWMENVRTGRALPDLYMADMNFLETPKLSGVEKILMSCGTYYHGGRPGNTIVEDWVGRYLMIEHPEKAWASDYVNDYIPGFKTTDWHDYGCSHYTASDNGGVGGVRRFIDGIHIEQLDVTWNRLTDLTGQLPGEMFSLLDDDARYLILGTGLNDASHYDHVIVGKRPGV